MKSGILVNRLFIISILFLFTGFACRAQNNNNYIEVVSNTSLNFSLNTVTEIETDQTKTGAITVQVKNRNSTRSVNARISNFSMPQGFYPEDSPLQLDYTSDNTNNAYNIITTPLTMTTTAQRLFTHGQHPNNSEYSIYYNLIMKETDWDYPPGNYTFTLEFTFY